MLSRVRVMDPGDTDLLPGTVIERGTFLDANEDVVKNGSKPAEIENLFLGVTKVSLSTDSWLSSASFQETARVLISASVTGKVDRLTGLKENVIIGRLIPAGTGFGVDLMDEEVYVEERGRVEEPDVERASDLDELADEAKEATSDVEVVPEKEVETKSAAEEQENEEKFEE